MDEQLQRMEEAYDTMMHLPPNYNLFIGFLEKLGKGDELVVETEGGEIVQGTFAELTNIGFTGSDRYFHEVSVDGVVRNLCDIHRISDSTGKVFYLNETVDEAWAGLFDS